MIHGQKNIKFSAQWKLTRHSLRNFLYYPYVVTPRSKYPPEHPVLRRLPATMCQYIAKCARTWAGTFHRKQCTSLRESSRVKQTLPVQTTRTGKPSQLRFLTWGPRTPRGIMYNFSRSVNLDGGGTTTLFALTSNWNFTFKSITNAGDKVIYGL